MARRIEYIESRVPDESKAASAWKAANLLPGGALKDKVVALFRDDKYGRHLTEEEMEQLMTWYHTSAVIEGAIAKNIQQK